MWQFCLIPLSCKFPAPPYPWHPTLSLVLIINHRFSFIAFRLLESTFCCSHPFLAHTELFHYWNSLVWLFSSSTTLHSAQHLPWLKSSPPPTGASSFPIKFFPQFFFLCYSPTYTTRRKLHTWDISSGERVLMHFSNQGVQSSVYIASHRPLPFITARKYE